jgi:hypothetical protein
MVRLMNGQLSMFDLMTFEDSRSVTSSPASADGRSPFDSPAGPTIAVCSGPDPAHANRSARQAKALGLLTSGTSGRPGTGSSRSVALTWSLGSRLRHRLDGRGSILFRLTWKDSATPAGRSCSLLRASGHRTNGTVYGSWPTPAASDMTGGGQAKRAMGETRHGSNLNDFALLASWPTPMAGNPGSETYNAAGSTDYERKIDTLFGLRETLNGRKLASWPTPVVNDANGSDYAYASGNHDTVALKLGGVAKLAGWATPQAVQVPESVEYWERTRKGKGMKGPNLHTQAQLASWATPKATDSKGNAYTATESRRSELRKQMPASGPTVTGSPAATASGGQLNPALSRWLMGLPQEWCDCAVTAMPSSRKSRQKS